MSDKLKTVFYEQKNYFEKMMGIKLERFGQEQMKVQRR